MGDRITSWNRTKLMKQIISINHGVKRLENEFLIEIIETK